jgi:hypothetical protein
MITITSLRILAIALLVFFIARSERTVHSTLRCPIRGTDVRVSYLEAEPVVFQRVVVGPFTSDLDMSRCARIRLYFQTNVAFAGFGLINLDGPTPVNLEGFGSTFLPFQTTKTYDVPGRVVQLTLGSGTANVAIVCSPS